MGASRGVSASVAVGIVVAVADGADKLVGSEGSDICCSSSSSSVSKHSIYEKKKRRHFERL